MNPRESDDLDYPVSFTLRQPKTWVPKHLRGETPTATPPATLSTLQSLENLIEFTVPAGYHPPTLKEALDKYAK